jgi:hypothetical protein
MYYKPAFSAEFPVALYGAGGGATLNGKPTVCGGNGNGAETNQPITCFQYSPKSNSWTASGRMTINRTWAGFDHTESWGLVIAGGWTVCIACNMNKGSARIETLFVLVLQSYKVKPTVIQTTSSVEHTFDGLSFQALPSMPNNNYGLCLKIYDDETIFAVGGRFHNGSHTPSAALSTTDGVSAVLKHNLIAIH